MKETWIQISLDINNVIQNIVNLVKIEPDHFIIQYFDCNNEKKKKNG